MHLCPSLHLTCPAAELLCSRPEKVGRAASTSRVVAKLRELPLQYMGRSTSAAKPSTQSSPSKPSPAAAPAQPAAAAAAAPAASLAGKAQAGPKPDSSSGIRLDTAADCFRAAADPGVDIPDLAARAAALAISDAKAQPAAAVRADRQPQPPPSVKHAPYNPSAPDPTPAPFTAAEVNASYASRQAAEAAFGEEQLDQDWELSEVRMAAAGVHCACSDKGRW